MNGRRAATSLREEAETLVSLSPKSGTFLLAYNVTKVLKIAYDVKSKVRCRKIFIEKSSFNYDVIEPALLEFFSDFSLSIEDNGEWVTNE